MAKRARKKRPPKRAQRSLLAPHRFSLPSLKLEPHHLDIAALGLAAAQGVTVNEAFYWDLDDGTRGFARRFMARHHANHVNVAYAPDDGAANRALAAKAAMFAELGVHVHLCGVEM